MMRNMLRGLLLFVAACLLGSTTTTSVHAWSSSKSPVVHNLRHNVAKKVKTTPLVRQRTARESSTSGNSVVKQSVAPLAWSKSLARPLLAEFIGTFIIVQFGTGAVMSAIFDGALVGLFQIAAVWGIAVTLAIYCTAHISGAHLNPSITIALALFRSFSWTKVIPYVLAQLSGATMASWLNLVLYSSKIRAFESSNNIIRGSVASIASAKAFGEYFVAPVGTATAILAEAFGTAVLAFVIFSLTNPKNDTTDKHGFHVPPLIGLCVAGLISVIAPINQAGFNPARDFGPRIVSWLAGWKSIAFLKWWVYVVGPIVGAPVGAFLADKVLFGKSGDDDKSNA